MKIQSLLALALVVPVSAQSQIATQQQTSEPPTRLDRLEITSRRSEGAFTYAKAHSLLRKFAKLTNKSSIDLVLYLRPVAGVSINPSDVKLNVQGESYVAKVSIADDWRLSVPLSQEALDENADFVMNQDVEKFQRLARIEIAKPSRTTMPLRYYFDALDEVVAAERRIVSLFSPKKLTVVFVFPKGVNSYAEVACEGSIVDVTNGPSARVVLDPSWQRRDCQITFSPALPTYSIPVHGR
jgi:hypothetical protein